MTSRCTGSVESKTIRIGKKEDTMTPYSAIRVSKNGTFYISGQLPKDLSATPGEQAASCFEVIGDLLKEHSIDKSAILKTTLFTTDLSALSDINEAYLTFFEGLEMPARSAFEVSSLAKGAKVEIDCYGEL